MHITLFCWSVRYLLHRHHRVRCEALHSAPTTFHPTLSWAWLGRRVAFADWPQAAQLREAQEHASQGASTQDRTGNGRIDTLLAFPGAVPRTSDVHHATLPPQDEKARQLHEQLASEQEALGQARQEAEEAQEWGQRLEDQCEQLRSQWAAAEQAESEASKARSDLQQQIEDGQGLPAQLAKAEQRGQEMAEGKHVANTQRAGFPRWLTVLLHVLAAARSCSLPRPAMS